MYVKLIMCMYIFPIFPVVVYKERKEPKNKSSFTVVVMEWECQYSVLRYFLVVYNDAE